MLERNAGEHGCRVKHGTESTKLSFGRDGIADTRMRRKASQRPILNIIGLESRQSSANFPQLFVR